MGISLTNKYVFYIQARTEDLEEVDIEDTSTYTECASNNDMMCIAVSNCIGIIRVRKLES